MRAGSGNAALAAGLAAAAVLGWCVCCLGGGSAARALVTAGTVLTNPVQAVQAAQELLTAPPEPDSLPQSEPERDDPAPAEPPEESLPEPEPPPEPLPADWDEVRCQDIPAPAEAGAVVERSYEKGSGEPFFAVGAGSFKNDTNGTWSTAELAAAAAAGPPFSIDPDSEAPQVLIVHTHATECYRMNLGQWYDPALPTRSTDESRNMCLVGEAMAQVLRQAGIATLHDTTLHDYPDYNPAYDRSRKTVQEYLRQYPSIQVVLDVHRDAIEAGGVRYAPVADINGRRSAQVMLIVGADNGGTLPDCRKNLAFAAAWNNKMERLYPGLTRSALFRYSFYNQDLSVGSVLIEVGGHGNTLDQAVYAGRLAASALAELLRAGE